MKPVVKNVGSNSRVCSPWLPYGDFPPREERSRVGWEVWVLGG